MVSDIFNLFVCKQVDVIYPRNRVVDEIHSLESVLGDEDGELILNDGEDVVRLQQMQGFVQIVSLEIRQQPMFLISLIRIGRKSFYRVAKFLDYSSPLNLPVVIMYGIMTEELVIREIRFTDDEFRGHYAT